MNLPAALNADYVMIALLAVNVLAILAYLVWLKKRTRRKQKNIARINAAILEYFSRSGVPVKVGSVSLHDNGLFTAFVESEPMKQFRLSHIIEMTLREHIAKTCKLRLEKIYWRFPIVEKPQDKAAKPKDETDDYINEGLVRYKDLPKSEVSEISWELFQELSTVETPKTEEENPPPEKN